MLKQILIQHPCPALPAYTYTHTCHSFFPFCRCCQPPGRLWKTALAAQSQGFTTSFWPQRLPGTTILESLGAGPASSWDHYCQEPQDAGLLALPSLSCTRDLKLLFLGDVLARCAHSSFSVWIACAKT